MARRQIETERKFDAPPGTELPPPERFAALPSVAAVEPADTEHLDARYYDTADLRLLRHRRTLRRRRGGHDAGWHLKQPAGETSRAELHLPDQDGIPDEFRLRTRAYVREADLVPVAALRTERRRLLLHDERGRVLAEIAWDRVEGERLTGDRATLAWAEIEAELVEGDPDLLDAVEEQLASAGVHRSTSRSKVGRVLGAPSADPEQEAPEGSWGAVLTVQLREQVARLLELDGEVRLDTPDSVHQMRIAARRLRSTLRAHARALDPHDSTAGFTAEAVAEGLRRLGRALGAARDHEVLGERLLDRLDALPAEERPGPMGHRIRSWARHGYRRHWRQAVYALESPDHLALLGALDALAAAPPLDERAAKPAADALPKVLRRQQRRVARRMKATRDAPDRDAALHAARKAAKRARYAAEGAGADRLAQRMKALQQLLGERQDALLARDTLRRLADRATAAGEPGFGYGVLYAEQSASIEAVDGQVADVWRRAAKPKLCQLD